MRSERQRYVSGARGEQQSEAEETAGRSDEGGAGPPPGNPHRRGISTLAAAATIAATEQAIDTHSSVKESRKPRAPTTRTPPATSSRTNATAYAIRLVRAITSAPRGAPRAGRSAGAPAPWSRAPGR